MSPPASKLGNLVTLLAMTAGVLLTLACFVFAGSRVWEAYGGFTAIATKDVRLQELIGTIVHLDEVLTMSARMAASTGERQWEERYRRFEPKLDAAIKEAIGLAPETFESEAAAQTAAANIKLVGLENRAFELVRQGLRDEAWEVLRSPEYQEQKQFYAQGMQTQMAAMKGRIRSQVESYHAQVLWVGLVAGLGMTILTLAWSAALVVSRAQMTKRRRAEVALKKAHDKLEGRVEERTAQLSEANAALREEVAARTRTEETVQRHAEELRRLSQRLAQVQEAERRHLATELHDEIGQLLAVLKWALQEVASTVPKDAGSKLAKAIARMDELIEGVRTLSLNLRPSMLDDFGLLPALLWLFEQHQTLHRVAVKFTHTGIEGRRFLPEVEITVYRIIQEALSNVARHATANEVQVGVTAEQAVLKLLIEDDGCGFDAATASPTFTVGLVGMRERAESVGGQLNVQSAPGSGTRVTVEVPSCDPCR